MKKKILLLLLLFVLMVGCFKEKEEELVVDTKLNAGVTTFIAKKDFEGIQIFLKNQNSEVNVSKNMLMIEEKTENGKIISIVKENDKIKKEDALFTVKNLKDFLVENVVTEIEPLKSNRSNTVNKLLGDFKKDGIVDVLDLNLFIEKFNLTSTDSGYNSEYDISPAMKGSGDWSKIYSISTSDGKIDLLDFVIFGRNYEKSNPVEEAEISSIEIIGESSVNIGSDITLQAKVIYDDGSNKIETVIWTSSNSNATINNSGIVTGISEGTVSIEAKKGEITATKSIIIKKVFSNGIKVHVKGYTTVWAWDADEVNHTTSGKWPGDEMPFEEGSTEWRVVTYEGLSFMNLIFSGGSNGQTNDLKREEEGEWWFDGTWHDVDPDVDITAPEITISPKAGNFEATSLDVTIKLADQDANAKAYYTINGTNPVIGGNEVSGLITINGDTTVKVIAIDSEGNTSSISSFTFDLDQDATAPEVNPSVEAGNYKIAQNITLAISDNRDSNPKLYYTIDGTEVKAEMSYLYNGQTISVTDGRVKINTLAVDNQGNSKNQSFSYFVGEQAPRTDFREESIYFLMTARFYDGDSSNNRYTRSGINAGAKEINDPAWRGDFKGLIEKLDYIKAMGFTAIWITPPVLNRSDCDYHGYHAYDMRKIDARLESPGATYQDLIDEIHARGMKVVQDIVINHSCKYGEKNLGGRILWGDSNDPDWGVNGEANYYDVENPDFEYNGLDYEPISGKNYYTGGTYQSEKPTPEQLPWLYDGDDSYMDPYLWIKGPSDLQPNLDSWGTKVATSDEGWWWRTFQWSEHAYTLLNPEYYHLINLGNWEAYDCQQGTMHPDCLDLNTESKKVQDYLIDTYNQYIDMGVDAFRIDTAKHISRVMFNRHFVPAWKERGGENFYMFGEVLVKSYDLYPNNAIPLGAPFYTWKEGADSQSSGRGDQLDPIDWKAAKQGYDEEQAGGRGGQPKSNNHYLDGNNYHTPDYSQKSGLDIIDMQAHVNFSSAGKVWGIKGNDEMYNDATWNVMYVDSHDYGPSTSSNRYAGGTSAWAENFSLMFTWRGIPCVYYGSEIEFKAGAVTDGDPNKLLLENSGRAYYGDHIEGSIDVTDFSEWSNATGELATTMEKPLIKHLASLNKMRRAIPALQKGQYSTDNIEGGMSFKKRYTNAEEGVDSFVLVTISQGATFNGLPAGTYVDVITGDTQTIAEGGTVTASCSGQGNLRVYLKGGHKMDGVTSQFIK